MSRLPVGILLAAGQSERFGSNKLLHRINNNTPMLMVTGEKLVNVLPDSLVIINTGLVSYTEELEQLGLRVILNEDANRGMGSSIACGVHASQDAMGWLIALADMPYIKTGTIRQLVNRIVDGARIVAPVFEKKRGHPVGFNHQFKNELITLNSDVGARHLITKYKEQFELIPTDDAGVILDVDYESDIS